MAAGNPPPCPHCGADIPDPRHLVCVQCLTELKPPDRRDGPSGDSSLRAGAADSYATVREGNGTQLMVRFDFGVIELLAGQEIMLGRDASDHRLAALRSRDNVSRTHATIGLSPYGAWIRDENSTNGTFINGRRVAAGDVVELPEGAELRLASNIRATVQVREAGK